MKPALIFHGMHGLGDNLHERAIVRELMRENEVWLATSWPQLFWDMPELHLVPLKSPIAWMAKNEARCAALYDNRPLKPGAVAMTNGYLSMMPKGIAMYGSVLGTMAAWCKITLTSDDFRMPIAPEWAAKADAVLMELGDGRPLMIYRPPVALSEANRGSTQAKIARNPDLAASHALLSAIRDQYFVISLADMAAWTEHLIGPSFKADAEFHHGELDVETIAAITAKADLVFASPGFMTVLAQAVSTPLICIFGGFEGKESFSAGGKFSPWLPIEPIHPCSCWQHTCTHDKTIEVPSAIERIKHFIAEHHANPADTEKTREPLAPGG
jgi:hypothetical protein